MDDIYGYTRQGQPFVTAKIMEIYLLRVLFEAQGNYLQVKDASKRIFNLIKHLLTKADQDIIGDGVKRWRNNILFARLNLANEGLIVPFGIAPYGHWELTWAGMQEACAVWANSKVV